MPSEEDEESSESSSESEEPLPPPGVDGERIIAAMEGGRRGPGRKVGEESDAEDGESDDRGDIGRVEEISGKAAGGREGSAEVDADAALGAVGFEGGRESAGSGGGGGLEEEDEELGVGSGGEGA